MLGMVDLLGNEYVKSLVILFGFIVLGRVFHFLVSRYGTRLMALTKTNVDDNLLRICREPVHGWIIIYGLYLSLKTLSFMEPYYNVIWQVFFVVSAFIVAVLLSRISAELVDKWLEVTKKYERIPQLINKIITITIFVIALIAVLMYFEIKVTPIIATLGVGGLAVGLALQNTLKNFFAGLHIISDRPVSVGDYVEIDEKFAGYVEDIGWRSTRIRTLPNTVIVVPNEKLAESIVVNDSMPQKEMSVLVQCGVAYKSNLKKVERVTIDVAKQIQKKVQGAVKDFEPFIRYHTFGDSNIQFTVILRVENYVDKYLVRHEFIKALKSRFDREKIEISFPVRKIVKGK